VRPAFVFLGAVWPVSLYKLCRPGPYNNIDINSEMYDDSFIEIDLDLSELQEFGNMTVRFHVKETTSVLITELTSELAIMKNKCREVSL
jgi:hypothetical protein